MAGKPYQVFVVLDRYFGDRLLTMAQDGPIWIIDSPKNQAAAHVCWNQNPVAGYLERVTLFKASDEISSEDALLANMDTIDLHHGEQSASVPYNVLQVFGTPWTPRVAEALLEYGFKHLEDVPDGFQAVRA